MIADDVRGDSVEIEGDQDDDNVCEDTIIPKPAASQARQVVDCLMNSSLFIDNQEIQSLTIKVANRELSEIQESTSQTLVANYFRQ